MRICLVTPFAWSQPHDVNEHVAGLARELRRLGHEVTVLAPSNRARRPARRPAGAAQRRRRAARGDRARPGAADLAAQPDGRPGRRAREPQARARARRFDVVHGFEPGCRASRTSRSATRTRSRSRRSSRPTGSATRPAAAARPAARPRRRAARDVVRGRRRGRRALPRATTGSSRPASTPSSSARPRSSG